MGRHRRARPTCRCRTTCAATTSPAPRTAAARAASTPACPASACRSRRRLPGQQLRHRRAAGQSGAAHADGQRAARAFPQLGDERHAAAAQPLSDAGAAARWCDANKAAMGFPTLPGCAPTVPEPDFIMPVLDYDWGPQFNCARRLRHRRPTRRRASSRCSRCCAPKVDADGNELGGVPVVLLDAPLGTYLGWNIAAGAMPFTKDQICNYVGGMIPFARTRGRAHGEQRSAPVAGGALRLARRLRRGGRQGGSARAGRRIPARPKTRRR